MPHTKQQIQGYLNSAGISPRRLWGQNFLIDLNLMRFLVDAAALKGNEVVLEIGCGTGSLTELLSDQAGKVIAVDIDQNLVKIARQQLESRENIQFINSDVLSTKNCIHRQVRDQIWQARQEFAGPFYMIANLPYQVAAPLMINLLLEEELFPDGMWVTIQAEVADRMTAGSGTKEYGTLSILLQATGTMKQLRIIKPQAFWPQPKVNSAMVTWRRDGEKIDKIDSLAQLKRITSMLLNQRRKKIRNCLVKEIDSKDSIRLLEKLGIDTDTRAETLDPDIFVLIANTLTMIAR
ncbi:MAG: ribosomal RNA small subunit methyltransferase A [Planctomycetes bacterium]|nr:ribosomal RNA small subunit methyltransferase A [Planctomycetota bacterium]